ncbi:hypothetical protein P7K49_038615 [Saguinus oedipus]|uniref:Uncharacterized protein n=1 Tax=Saguinus oedipus TaxID=9490 RepID=A0ABQ9TF81_SAGOE|nr:hypothetical protein P7K49_038615 [Saguinus oedipus]
MCNFIHRKLVQGGSSPCIIQTNNGNFVLLGEERDTLEPPPLLLLLMLLQRWPRARFQGIGGRPKPRPPCSARGPAWLAVQPASRATVLPQLLLGGCGGDYHASRPIFTF